MHHHCRHSGRSCRRPRSIPGSSSSTSAYRSGAGRRARPLDGGQTVATRPVALARNTFISDEHDSTGGLSATAARRLPSPRQEDLRTSDRLNPGRRTPLGGRSMPSGAGKSGRRFCCRPSRECDGRPVPASRDPAVRSWEPARGQPHRRDPLRRDRGRCAAGRRGVPRDRLGEQPLARRLRRRVGVPDRPGRAAPGPHRCPVGRRGPAGDLLLRRRPGAQTRVRRRRPAEPPPRRTSRRGRRRRHGSPAPNSHRN